VTIHKFTIHMYMYTYTYNHIYIYIHTYTSIHTYIKIRPIRYMYTDHIFFLPCLYTLVQFSSTDSMHIPPVNNLCSTDVRIVAVCCSLYKDSMCTAWVYNLCSTDVRVVAVCCSVIQCVAVCCSLYKDSMRIP